MLITKLQKTIGLCLLCPQLVWAQLSTLPSSVPTSSASPPPVQSVVQPSGGQGLSSFNPQVLVQTVKDTPYRSQLYSGAMLNGHPEGAGFFVINGSTYASTFAKGEPTGQSKITDPNGYSYTGGLAWSNNRLTQQGYGQASWADGASYEGNYENGLREGAGKYREVSGNVYTGAFSRGKYQGKGVMAYKSGGRYEGEFHDGKLEGQGFLRLDDGGTFAGSFKGGAMWAGRMLSSNNIHSATFDNGVRNNIAAPPAPVVAAKPSINTNATVAAVAEPAGKSIIDQLKDKETRDKLKDAIKQFKETREASKSGNTASVNPSKCLYLKSESYSKTQDVVSVTSSCAKPVDFTVVCSGRQYSGKVFTGGMVLVAHVPKNTPCRL